MIVFRYFVGLNLTLFLMAATLQGETGQRPADPEFFTRNLYPILEEAECRECHNDNGVASTTRLQFPPKDATPTEILRFGLSMKTLVDTKRVDRSLLLGKPTNRLEHTGGERVEPGSSEEKTLRTWIEYLVAYRGNALPANRRDARHVPEMLRRLTRIQYNNTLRDLLSDHTHPADEFPAEDFVHGFTNQAEGQSVSPLLVEAWNRAAEKAARLAFLGGDRHGLIPSNPVDVVDAACREDFVRQFGRRAFRRPLAESEVRLYDKLFSAEARSAHSIEAGAQAVVEAMLQSPYFLFHLEAGADGRLENYRAASRLSYFLWNTMPDDRLFVAAERGELTTQEGIEKHARRLLADARARGAFNEFLAQWLRFDRLRSAVRDRRLFPEFTDELVHDMTEEVRRLFEHVVWNEHNFFEFFTADYAYLSNELARLYDVEPPAQTAGVTRLPQDSARGGGVLGTGLYLALTSKPSGTSPTERGLFVREHFLCQEVPPPPPGVDSNLPASTVGQPRTNRERLAIHLVSPNCASCHNLLDPIGFGLEHFDAIGRYRPKHVVTKFPTAEELREDSDRKPQVHELVLDVTASVRGIANSQFSSPKQLGEILAANRSCRRCVVKQLFRYATGRLERAADQPVIDSAMRDFAASGFRFQDLIISIVKSKAYLGEVGG